MNLFKKVKQFFQKKQEIKKLFLIAKGRASTEESDGFERYTGIGVVNVIGVNPNKEELSKLLDREISNEPVYIYPQATKEDRNACRIVFVVKTTDHEDNGGIDVVSQMSFHLRDAHLTSTKTGVEKVKVIDKYAQTSWVTEEELKNQTPPLQRNGKRGKIIAPFRPMYQGEEELLDFLRKFLNVPEAMNWNKDTGEWTPIADLDTAEISLSSIMKYFEGNVDDIRDAVMAWPDNRVKVLFYTRETEDNKTYQSVLTDLVLRPGARNYEPFQKMVEDKIAAGMFANCSFTYGPIDVQKLTPTGFTQEPKEEPQSPWFKK